MNKYIFTYKIFEADDFRPPEYRKFKENPTIRHELLKMDEKKFNEIYPKYQWHLVNKNKPLIKNNLFTLVNLAYDKIGGHVRINSPEKVVEDTELNFWTAADKNNDPYADIVIFGKKTDYGIKISGFGHNTTSESKEELIDHVVKLLNTDGYFIEASGQPAKRFVEREVPIVHDINIIRKIFNSPDAIYIDPGHTWYVRCGVKTGDKYKEILFGKPLV